MQLKPYILVFLFCSLLGIEGIAQKQSTKELSKPLEELGIPFVTNYSPKEYNSFSQNWGAVKDSLGILYFANGNGVLVYDGASWETIELPKKTHVKSIAIDSTGRVFVGASGEFGYIQSDKYGGFEYFSLVPKLEKKYRDFSTVWECLATPKGVFFRTIENVYLWTGSDFKIFNVEGEKMNRMYAVKNVLYTWVKGIGLMFVENNQLKLVKGGEQFADDLINIVLPYKEKGLLIGTYTEGFFLYVNGRKTKFHTNADQYFLNNKLNAGILLHNGYYALGTLNEGIIFINERGEQQFVLDDSNVLNSLIVLNLYQDGSGIIWASLNTGIAKIEYPSPFTWFNQYKGIKNRVQIICSYEEQLYVGTSNGLYKLNTNSQKRDDVFELEQTKKEKIWDLIVFRDKLLVAETDELYQICNNVKTTILLEKPSALCISKIDTNRVFVTTSKGLRSIYYQDNRWIDEGEIEGVNSSVYTIVEMDSGNLWLETSENWIWKVEFETKKKAKFLKKPKITKFGQNEGLPDDYGNLFKLNNELYFVGDIERKTYIFNKNISKFELATDLAEKLKVVNDYFIIGHIDSFDNIWFSKFTDDFEQESFVAWNTDSGYNIENLNQKRVLKKLGGSYTKYFDNNNRLWLTGDESVILHDLSKPPLAKEKFNTVINNIYYHRDSVLVKGPYHTATATLPFANNQFRFQYASPSFYDESKNQFQYYLEGFDQDWSKWSLETKKDYTNIPEGTYTFKVRAKNIFGDISKEDSYVFTILPPWYRTWWAYLVCFLGAVLTIVLFSQWRSKQLRVKNLALEKTVANRTEEISKKNSQLESQTERLKEMDTMKTRLFANISHEFRTPLTLIKGPIEKLEETQKNTISTSNIKMIRRNANRLLKLVNQLLDLSKLDSGKLQLNVAEGDVFKCIRTAASAFSSHAASRNIDYRIKIPSRPLWGSFDRDKIEKIIYNLLSNAFKFTADEGKISITTTFRHNQLELKVSDTGNGIAAEKLPYIYDRFFQVDDSYTREKVGSGIGLALTKELVQLMNGKIYVESELGKGTRFKVLMPIEEIISYQKEAIQEMPITVFENEDKRPASTVSNKRSNKILIIEDNNDMRYFIREQLIQDYDIFEAPNGKEGLKKATKLMPDLIITDLMMPQMDGITLCKKLKTNLATSHIPVIMLTAKAGIENKLEGLETGADDYLTKPFNAKELQVRTKNLIAQRQQLRELFSKNISLDPKEITVTSLDNKFLGQVLALLEEKHADSEFGVPQMQKHLAMGKTRLHTKTKALTDQPPGELLRNFRLKRAARLLSKNADNISQVAYSVGFNSLSYFTRCFREYYGMSPSKFIKKDSSNT